MKKLCIVACYLLISIFVFSGCDFSGFAGEESKQEKSKDNNKDKKKSKKNKKKDKKTDKKSDKDKEVEQKGVNNNIDDGAYSDLTHTFALYNRDGYKICNLSLPPNCELEYESEEKTFFSVSLSLENFYMIYISAYDSAGIGDYILTGTEPNEYVYPDFKCDYEQIENDDIQYYKVHYSTTKDNETTDYYTVVVPYIDLEGNNKFFDIEIDKDFYNDWDDGTGKAIAYLLRKTDDGDGDSLIEDHEVNSLQPDLGTISIIDEDKGEFTLFSSEGYKILSFKQPDDYKMNSYSDRGRHFTLGKKDDEIRQRIEIRGFLDTPLYEYVVEEEMPDSTYYADFTCQCTEEVLGNYPCSIYDFTYSFAGYDYERFVILFEFDLLSGEHEYVSIEISEKLFEKWDESTKDIIIEMLSN